MKQRKAILIIAAAVCLVNVVIIAIQIQRGFGSHAAMPVYQGRTAREWLDQVFTTNQAAAFTAFKAMGTNAFPVLVRAMNDSQWDRIYGSMYSNMPVAIQKRMAVPNSRTTWSAAQLMLVNEPRSFEAAPDLARLLRNKHNRARQYILWALQVRSVALSAKVTPFVIECVNDPDPRTRAAAGAALARLGPLSDAAITNLAAALHDSSTEVKMAAAVTLGRNGPAARFAAPDLKALLHDSSSDVRIQAAVALWQIGGEGLPIEAITKTLAAEARKNSGIAIVQLYRVAPDYPGMRSMLMYVLRTDRTTLRPIAALDLSSSGEDAKEVVPIILDLLEQSRGDSYSNTQYLQALEKIDPQAAQKYKHDHPER
jgi:hypothetical protein